MCWQVVNISVNIRKMRHLALAGVTSGKRKTALLVHNLAQTLLPSEDECHHCTEVCFLEHTIILDYNVLINRLLIRKEHTLQALKARIAAALIWLLMNSFIPSHYKLPVLNPWRPHYYSRSSASLIAMMTWMSVKNKTVYQHSTRVEGRTACRLCAHLIPNNIQPS